MRYEGRMPAKKRNQGRQGGRKAMRGGFRIWEHTFASLPASTRILSMTLRNLALYCAYDQLDHLQMGLDPSAFDHRLDWSAADPRPDVRTTANLLHDVARLLLAGYERDLTALASNARLRWRKRNPDHLSLLPDLRERAVWLERRMQQPVERMKDEVLRDTLRNRARILAPEVLGAGFRSGEECERVCNAVSDRERRKYEVSDIREAVIAMLKAAADTPQANDAADHVFDKDFLREKKGRPARKPVKES